MKRRPRHDRRATAATELALTLPLLLTLILGCIDFGRIAYTYCVVSNASRTGAEYGATHGFTSYTRASWQSRLEECVTAEMSSVPGFDPSQLQVVIGTISDSYGLFRVTVEVEYPFTTVVPWPGTSQNVLLWSSTSMRQIR
ncbi:MAG TPA: TadE/TadG family type IV pilus assembly protein [Pirellulales bacterium]|nr:TadE/TadG family type IV pilus assembly protein [Pirellulales bacterium]